MATRFYGDCLKARELRTWAKIRQGFGDGTRLNNLPATEVCLFTEL
jgi:hypothetical protein